MPKKEDAESQIEQPRFVPRYPAIEKLIDSEDFDEINTNFGQAYRELETTAKQKGLGKSREARKAMKALEKAMDLLAYLLKLKFQYLESQAGGSGGGEKSPRKKSSGDKQLQQSRAR